MSSKSPRAEVKPKKPTKTKPKIRGGCVSGVGGGITKAGFIKKEKPPGKRPPIKKAGKRQSS